MRNFGAFDANPLARDQATLDQFFDLATAEDLPDLLERALRFLNSFFQTQGSSIFFQGAEPCILQHETMPQAVLDHIGQWEMAVAERLKNGTWHILEDDPPPISTHHDPHYNLTVINTPLLRKSQVTGSLSLVLPYHRLLDPAQQALLLRLAGGIGYLGHIARNLALTRQRYNELDMLYNVGQVLSTTHDVTEVLEKVMHLTADVLDAAAASILLLDQTRQELVFEACHSPRSELLRRYRISLHEGIAGWVATHNQSVIANNARLDPRFNQQVDARTGFLTRSIAAVPLRLKGQVVGVLEALNKDGAGEFTQDDLRLLTAIAAQAAMTLENARLYQNLRDERDRIIKAQEDVRRALSRNLHDGTVQHLAAISMNLEYIQKLIAVDPQAAIQEIETLQKLVRRASQEARLVLFELRPVILETEGLASALEKYADQLNESEAFTISLTLDPLPPDLHKNIAGTIFSIVQEAVNNAKRHAGATEIKIILQIKGNQLLTHIKDNGHGFDLEQVETGYAERNSFGLLNMKERAELIEGVLAIHSKASGPNHGTIITLSTPLKPSTGSLQKSLVSDNNYEE